MTYADSQQDDGIRYCIGVRGDNDATEKILVTRKEDSINELRRQSLNISGISKITAINYGLWIPPRNGKQGKFLQDERPVQDYIDLFVPIESEALNNIDVEGMMKLEKDVNWLKLLYKSRFYDDGITENKIKKVNSKVNQKALIEGVKNNDIAKVDRLLTRGLDPNFNVKTTGETPMTILMGQKNCREMILKLIEGGAHIDFRSTDSLTPLHKATINGNYEAMQTLLDLGQNPNCRDSKNLTPLYHGVSIDSPGKCSHCLLYDHAILGVQDDLGFQEIHQACRFGRTQHLDNLINYGANLNALTKKSNTPLHICVVADQEECLRLLLIRGADKNILNVSGQTPYQCALLTNRNHLAEIIENFEASSILAVNDPPIYNERRRPIVNGPRAAVLNAEIKKRQKQMQEENLRERRKFSLDNTMQNYNLNVPHTNLMSLSRPDLSTIGSNKKKEKVYFIRNGKVMNYDFVERNEESETEHVINLQQRSFSNAHLDQIKSENMDRLLYQHKKYFGKLKTIILPPNPNGYGFVLKGSKTSHPKNKHLPTQYLTNIQHNSPAYFAGIRNGDYLLEINNQDVSDYSHDQTVALIKRNMNDTIKMLVLNQKEDTEISVPIKNAISSHSGFDSPMSSSSEVKDDDDDSNKKIIFIRDIIKKKDINSKLIDYEDYHNHKNLLVYNNKANIDHTDYNGVVRMSSPQTNTNQNDNVKIISVKDKMLSENIQLYNPINKSNTSISNHDKSISTLASYNKRDEDPINNSFNGNNTSLSTSSSASQKADLANSVNNNQENSVKKMISLYDERKSSRDSNHPTYFTHTKKGMKKTVKFNDQRALVGISYEKKSPPPVLPKPKNPRKPNFMQDQSTLSEPSSASLPFESVEDLIRQKNLLRPLSQKVN